ncbi:DUF917 family protein [Youngiibacter multivorans]|uniref:DUF917 family protein n=1 Tax=Youngiibacter multivorans TaxID=937251 RepID=A0ABS4G6H8_9CLOT|nr:DUF917 family protein [Youngiibacter multivorans]MBP1920126.1 DUF917 family protein [Youngiibacter multivorans]
MTLDRKTIEELATGGVILGAGGGGSKEMGLKAGLASFEYGEPRMIQVDKLEDSDMVVTISGVGSPASKGAYIENSYYNKIIEILTEELGQKPAALIPSEMGGSSSFGPFIASAINGIPVLDAACNGRAHPLGTMGSMGLNETKGYKTIQVAMGGDPAADHMIEMTAKGSVPDTASLVLATAIRAGGLVVVARNPVPVKYVKEKAAVGCYTHSLEVGKAHMAGKTAMEKIKNVADALGGKILCQGEINSYMLETRNGLDVGGFIVNDGKEYSIKFWNEYMAIDCEGERLFTFPDYMMTFELEKGEPITTANITEGISVAVVTAPRTSLILGGGMFEASGYKAVEDAIGIPMLPYVQDLVNK